MVLSPHCMKNYCASRPKKLELFSPTIPSSVPSWFASRHVGASRSLSFRPMMPIRWLSKTRILLIPTEVHMAQYLTITLQLLEDNPRLYDRLHQHRLLLPTLDFLARRLKDNHEAWKAHLRRTRPHSDPDQLANDALELALNDLQNALLIESPASDDEVLSLDAAMSFVRRHMPAA